MATMTHGPIHPVVRATSSAMADTSPRAGAFLAVPQHFHDQVRFTLNAQAWARRRKHDVLPIRAVLLVGVAGPASRQPVASSLPSRPRGAGASRGYSCEDCV